MHFGYEKILDIPNTLDLIIDCWKIAEESLRTDILNCYPDADEEFMTQLFHGKLAAVLMLASKFKFIENAFLADLQMAFPDLYSELGQIADGLIAEITLHKRITERITGGDIGLVILRPQVSEQEDCLKIRDYRRGILCQAKMKRASGKWGSFTENQINILPQRMHYFALLLYSYEDDKRTILQPFSWQRCESAEFNHVKSWLKSDSFPKLERSDVIIANLGYGNIGTDKDEVIDEMISPAKNPSLVITINWPENRRPGGPDSKVSIYTRQEQKELNTVKIGY